ncbi:hypothetical protein MMC18_003258 [Xylographa bjoerkii]|nr:hypothetical protein [Xylographa bjoerkii]
MSAPPDSINLGNTQTDSPPQLGEISHPSEMRIPTLSSTNGTSGVNGNTSMEDAKNAVYGNAQSAFNTVANHPVTQNVKDTISSGLVSDAGTSRPVAESVKDQSAKTTSEFSNLANARTTPDTKAATGQPLTHYHSFFYNLLSWENPRATAISFIATILFIFGARYLPALRWSFKILWMTLGIAASAEIAGKLVLNQGLASSFRPRKYYTIPRETLESSLEDVEQLINFFVIEFQRVLFAENVLATVAAFAAALISHGLIKLLPLWGLSLIAVSVIYLAPLIYISNKELIDHHVANASNIANAQAKQVQDLAGHHTARLTETVKAQTSTYSAKAQEYMGAAKDRTSTAVGNAKQQVNQQANSASAAVDNAKQQVNQQANSAANSASNNPFKSGADAPPSYSSSDFPHAPKQEPIPGVASHQEQYEKSQFGGQAQFAS